MHVHRHEVVLDGVGDGRVAAVGERQRRAVGAEHGKKVDALWRGLRERREQPSAISGSSCLMQATSPSPSCANSFRLMGVRGRRSSFSNSFIDVHSSLRGVGGARVRCHATSLDSAATMPTFGTFFPCAELDGKKAVMQLRLAHLDTIGECEGA